MIETAGSARKDSHTPGAETVSAELLKQLVKDNFLAIDERLARRRENHVQPVPASPIRLLKLSRCDHFFRLLIHKKRFHLSERPQFAGEVRRNMQIVFQNEDYSDSGRYRRLLRATKNLSFKNRAANSLLWKLILFRGTPLISYPTFGDSPKKRAYRTTCSASQQQCRPHRCHQQEKTEGQTARNEGYDKPNHRFYDTHLS